MAKRIEIAIKNYKVAIYSHLDYQNVVQLTWLLLGSI